ncbi:coiled-coil domain-containing protein 201 isoform X2 [Cavia porcellus]|uniref:coiled-coil domain-containing protein 201 isoform X2 n=1 Tax=Cavia porcellus TaxID=10141 RepID=UPI002FE15877
MELGEQIPELSSSEDESPPRMPRRPPWKMPTKHSTPEGQEPALHWSPRPRGQASYLRESPVPAHSTQDLGSHLAGLSPGATFKRRRLSTIYALEERPSMQAGSCSDPSALRDDSPVPASLARSQQKAKNLQAKSWPRSTGLPGIPDTTRRKRRDPKGQAAVGPPAPQNPNSWKQLGDLKQQQTSGSGAPGKGCTPGHPEDCPVVSFLPASLLSTLTSGSHPATTTLQFCGFILPP